MSKYIFRGDGKMCIQRKVKHLYRAKSQTFPEMVAKNEAIAGNGISMKSNNMDVNGFMA